MIDKLQVVGSGSSKGSVLEQDLQSCDQDGDYKSPASEGSVLEQEIKNRARGESFLLVRSDRI